jgi:hypothetical protein
MDLDIMHTETNYRLIHSELYGLCCNISAVIS